MDLMKLRSTVGIGMLALMLAGGLAPGMADAKDHHKDPHKGGVKHERGAKDERGAGAGLYIPPEMFKCNGVLMTMLLSPSQNGQEVQGTNGRDVVIGTAGRDIFVGNGGDDIVCLKGGNDEFRPGTNAGSIFDGNDTVFGGAGNDTLSGGRGDDVLQGEADGDAIRGQEGTNDLCNGGPGGGDYQLGEGGCETVLGIP